MTPRRVILSAAKDLLFARVVLGSAQYLLFALVILSAAKDLLSQSRPTTPYIPPYAAWDRRSPADVGVDPAKLDSAIAFAIAAESKAARDQAISNAIGFSREPYGEPAGPFAPRGNPSGVIVRRGYVIATWGDPAAVEMTHSVTKSFLSVVTGLAVDRKLIRSVNDTVRAYVGPLLAFAGPGATGATVLLDPFGSPHNRTITWDHLLRQTSDWEGTLWGKPDWADRPEGTAATWRTRERRAPGSFWKYNDVRVNALALASLAVWRQPLPEVLRESVMDPIGASRTWRWYGYDASWVVLDGRPVQSVSGGGHWGGGMFISAWDMARFGLLTLRRGKWGDRQLVSDAWVTYALTPTPANAGYGTMNWFLNGDGKLLPSAPRTAFMHVGNGTNAIYVDPEHDLVAVVRWIENSQLDGFVKRLLEAAPGR